MPDGTLCGPKRPRSFCRGQAVLRVTVGLIGVCSYLINIGSGASAPLPGTLGPTAWTPTPFLPRPMSSQAAGSVAPVGDTTKDSYIPVLSNRPQDYKEWRQRICLYKKKLDLQKKPKEATLNLLTSLTGVSWRQVEHLVDKVADETDGFEQVLAQLDRCFKYDDRVEMPRALKKFFYGSTRRGDQSLLQYCADHREACR